MLVKGSQYKTIWTDDSRKVKIIDQTYLPFNFKIIELENLYSAIDAIKNMRVRGAPLIGVTAAYGIYLASKLSTSDESLIKAGNSLIETRPTAINLKWSIEKILSKVLSLKEKEREEAAFHFSEELSKKDESINKKIGSIGSKLIEDIYKKNNKPVNILTHCNAGWLATVNWGTATAPIYKAREKGIPIHVWVDETRPRNQGSFLTSWELQNENINHTIITDNAGGHLMQIGAVDLVITGSDRTLANGDVCNKVGTYLKALAAYANNVPFYVSLPSSTIDWSLNNSKEIVIEERNENEIHYIKGLNKDGNVNEVRITPIETAASNYSFDITPSKYISGLITEFGLLKAKKEEILKIYNNLI